MKFTLLGLYDRGVLSKERVHFRADIDLDLSFFMVLDSFWLGVNQVQAGYRAGYWFPPHAVKRYQHVVLYTRPGNPTIETHSDGSTYHFLFRGSSAAIYTTPSASAVLLEINTWASIPAAAPTIGSALGGVTSSLPMTLGDYFKIDGKK